MYAYFNALFLLFIVLSAVFLLPAQAIVIAFMYFQVKNDLLTRQKKKGYWA